MSNNISYVGDDNFKQEVIDSEQLVLVDFYADWCMPCKMLAPILEEVADSNIGKVKVAKLNVDGSRDISIKYRIMGVPSMIFFKNGEEIDRIVGLRSKEELQRLIDSIT